VVRQPLCIRPACEQLRRTRVRNCPRSVRDAVERIRAFVVHNLSGSSHSRRVVPPHDGPGKLQAGHAGESLCRQIRGAGVGMWCVVGTSQADRCVSTLSSARRKPSLRSRQLGFGLWDGGGQPGRECRAVLGGRVALLLQARCEDPSFSLSPHPTQRNPFPPPFRARRTACASFTHATPFPPSRPATRRAIPRRRTTAATPPTAAAQVRRVHTGGAPRVPAGAGPRRGTRAALVALEQPSEAPLGFRDRHLVGMSHSTRTRRVGH
jgi:hypothetical protein